MIVNFIIFNFKINDEDMKILSTIDTGKDGSWPSKMREDFIKFYNLKEKIILNIMTLKG